MKNLSLSHKLFIVLGAIAIGCNGTIDSASADTPLKVNRSQTTTVVPRQVTISGYLVDTDGTYNNVPCTELKVTLSQNSKVLATTNGIRQPDGTCQYEFNFSQPRSHVRFLKEQTYLVVANGQGYGGNATHQTQERLPDSLLLNVRVGKYGVIK